jgi:hypothetical protein
MKLYGLLTRVRRQGLEPRTRGLRVRGSAPSDPYITLAKSSASV